MTTNLSDYVQRLRDALTDAESTLCSCRYGNRRESEECNCDLHAARRIMLLALAEPVPLALHDAQVLREACKAVCWMCADEKPMRGYNHLHTCESNSELHHLGACVAVSIHKLIESLEAEARKGAAPDEA